jgi:hypothetical protein
VIRLRSSGIDSCDPNHAMRVDEQLASAGGLTGAFSRRRSWWPKATVSFVEFACRAFDSILVDWAEPAPGVVFEARCKQNATAPEGPSA